MPRWASAGWGAFWNTYLSGRKPACGWLYAVRLPRRSSAGACKQRTASSGSVASYLLAGYLRHVLRA